MKCLIACRVVVCVLSLPLWERGLKCVSHTVNMQDYIVAPLVGAWIEILTSILLRTFVTVAPLVGAWIEIIIIFESR